MARGGLRFLARVYQNLPDDIKNRSSNGLSVIPTIKESAVVPKNTSITDLISRLDSIEQLLNKILIQKRVKLVERDSDDLIVRVVDIPMEDK